MKCLILSTLMIFLLMSNLIYSQDIDMEYPYFWRAVLELKESQELAFVMTSDQETDFKHLQIHNGEERIRVDEVRYVGDSVFIKLPYFESEIKAVVEKDALSGYWYNYAKGRDYKVPFRAKLGEKKRYTVANPSEEIDVSGQWTVTFSPDDPQSMYPAVGEFYQQGHQVLGTFKTMTGDYRFLEGVMDGEELILSCFDGAHAFLFKAKVNADSMSMKGTFWSGAHWQEAWKADLNETIELPDPNSLTYLKDGYDRFEFSFPDLNKEMVSLKDERFKDKVVMVQILGSWCPNCMDEAALYADLYREMGAEGLEIVGLAFERSESWEVSQPILERYKKQMGIDYPILLAGRASKKEASEKLPMLNRVMSFPTTVFVDKQGNVRRIHTGFNGPATSNYAAYEQELRSFLKGLLAE